MLSTRLSEKLLLLMKHWREKWRGGEIDFMEDVESCMPDLNSTLVLDSSIITNQSVNRSGLVWVSVSTNEASTQTDPIVVDQTQNPEENTRLH